MSEVLFMAIERGDIFTAGTEVVYEALGDPEPGEQEGELEVSVRRIAGPDIVTGIKHIEPGTDWTDVECVSSPVPAESKFRAGWDGPVTLVRKSY